MSLSEFKFPLPASRDLWLAPTADAWRDLYLSRPPLPTDMPNLLDAMLNIDILELFSNHIDVHLCVDAILHCYWGQIWAYHRSNLLYSESKVTLRLCLATERRELYKELHDFSSKIPTLANSPSMTFLFSELLMMLLFTDPDELQRFAGKYGEEEAKQSSHGFRLWGQTLDSRTAIWHAGQVVRAARQIPPARLRGLSAIAVYYAIMTLWIYGLMLSSASPQAVVPRNSHRAWKSFRSNQLSRIKVELNEPETSHSRAFISNNEGIPGLSLAIKEKTTTDFIALEETDRILGLAREILERNFSIVNESLPPLVENLCNLLKDLASLPGSRVSRVGSEIPDEPRLN